MLTFRAAIVAVAVTAVVWLGAAPGVAEAQTVQARFEAARKLETDAIALIDRTPSSSSASARTAAMTAAHRAVVRFETFVREHPRSGYADNALRQAADLSRRLFEVYERPSDRTAALKYYAWLTREYPGSGLGGQARSAARALEAPKAAAVRPAVPDLPAAAATLPPSSTRALTQIERVVLGSVVRVTIYLDGEVSYSHDLLSGPARVFVDLQGATPGLSLADATLRYDDSAVRQVRIGRQLDATRVVLDLEGSPRISVFTLYNPFRIVVDAESGLPTSTAETTPVLSPPGPTDPPAVAIVHEEQDPWTESERPVSPGIVTPSLPDSTSPPLARVHSAEDDAPGIPATPAANVDGSFSLARQLGLGVSRIVIDAGHGGHDPGTLVSGSSEAAIVLDVALRLERLLKKEPGLDVVLTRRTNTFVPLEQRTAIANREGADLFLSIHANSGRDPSAKGIETYYLSFASNPEAEMVAARENVTSDRDMHNLPGIVRAIALNNKLDESRDLAALVQQSLSTRLSGAGATRSRGVKKAPFVVLIGAGMPSVLAEIGFLTNRGEAAALKTPAYRQRVAEALLASVLGYRRALKRQSTVAAR